MTTWCNALAKSTATACPVGTEVTTPSQRARSLHTGS